jgi:hypothetical protein
VITSARIDPRFGVVSDPFRFAALLIWLVLSGCVYVPSVMWNRAEANRARIDRVQVGQTLDEVRSTMGTPPEKREVRARFDGKTVELWSYATDYTRKVETTIIFLDGRVTEIRATSWQERD